MTEMEEHWRWRMRMALEIAGELDPAEFGIVNLYIIGSTKNATAGPASDIDLLVHFRGSQDQETRLRARLADWSFRLAASNQERTGLRTDGLLDVHWLTDEDIARRTSYAVMIGASTDAARPLPMKRTPGVSSRSSA
jgi:predicted nucleotidyltransferase